MLSDSDDEGAPPELCTTAYIGACATSGTAKCSRWLRACSLRQEECSLAHYGLGTKGASPLAASLALNKHLRLLDLSDNGMGAEGAAAVLAVLTRGGAPALASLSLSRNQAGPEGADAVGELLRARPGHALLQLDFSANAVGDRGARTIADGLAENTTIDNLLLDDNGIDTEGAEHLAKALKTNTRLRELSLEWNAIRAEGGRAIANALRDQHTLLALNLGWNGLGDDGVAAVASALTPPPGAEGAPCALSELRLHHNRLTTQGGGALALVLGSLASLDVSGNPLGSGGAAALLLAQQGAAAPCKLVASDVCVRPESALDVLLIRASRGEALERAELLAAGVDSLAASVLTRAVEAVRAERKKPKKGVAGQPTEKAKKKPPAREVPTAPTRRGSARKSGDSGAEEWRRTDQRPDLDAAAVG